MNVCGERVGRLTLHHRFLCKVVGQRLESQKHGKFAFETDSKSPHLPQPQSSVSKQFPKYLCCSVK